MDKNTGALWVKHQISFQLHISVDSEGEPLAELMLYQGDTRLTWDSVPCRWSELPSALCEALHEVLSFDIPSSDGASA
jgi:hypothetical protein